MHPHCSLYGYLAFKRHNPVKAFLMTADRLHRCGHDLDNYETVEVNGLVRFLDPVDALWSGNESDTDVVTRSEVLGQLSPNTCQNKDISGASVSEDSRLSDSENPSSFTQAFPKLVFHFAETLQSEGNYERAIIEYRRLLSYFPDSNYRKQASKSVFYCYYKAEQYLTAIHWGQELLEEDIASADADEIRFFIGASYFKVGNYPRARSYFTEVANDGELGDKSLILQGLSYAMETSWEYAEVSFARIGPDSKFSDKARQCEKLSQDGRKLGLKSPAIAGILAVVPGLGYLYDGYKQTALSAFVVNSLFIWSTIEAFRRDSKSLGTMLGVLSFGWYTGNIYGSVVSAQRRNIKLKNDLLLQFDIGFHF